MGHLPQGGLSDDVALLLWSDLGPAGVASPMPQHLEAVQPPAPEHGPLAILVHACDALDLPSGHLDVVIGGQGAKAEEDHIRVLGMAIVPGEQRLAPGAHLHRHLLLVPEPF